jgi:hypothetical protein
MNFKNITIGKKIIIISLAIASVISLLFLIYALMYADAESVYRKNGFVIGLFFIALTRFTMSFYKKAIGHSK